MNHFWWLIQAAMTIVSIFFLIFGIDLLIGAYSLKDPFTFIMTFFAASFIILISLTLAITFVIKMIRVWRRVKQDGPDVS